MSEPVFATLMYFMLFGFAAEIIYIFGTIRGIDYDKRKETEI